MRERHSANPFQNESPLHKIASADLTVQHVIRALAIIILERIFIASLGVKIRRKRGWDRNGELMCDSGNKRSELAMNIIENWKQVFRLGC